MLDNVGPIVPCANNSRRNNTPQVDWQTIDPKTYIRDSKFPAHHFIFIWQKLQMGAKFMKLRVSFDKLVERSGMIKQWRLLKVEHYKAIVKHAKGRG